MKKFVDFIIKNFIYLVIILIDVIGFIEIDKLLESSDYGPFKYVFSAGIYAICVIICAITFKKMANKKLKTEIRPLRSMGRQRLWYQSISFRYKILGLHV